MMSLCSGYSCNLDEVLQGLISDDMCLLQAQKRKQTGLNLREAKHRHKVCLPLWTNKDAERGQQCPWREEEKKPTPWICKRLRSQFLILSLFFLHPTHSPVTALFDFKFSKVQVRYEKYCVFSTLHEEASENHLYFFDYFCPRKQLFLMSRFKRTRYGISLTNVLLNKLEWQHVDSDPDCLVFHYFGCSNDLQQQQSSWTCWWPDTSQGTVPLCSRTPVFLRVGEISTWYGMPVVLVVS